MWPCDELVTCPGCSPRTLGINNPECRGARCHWLTDGLCSVSWLGWMAVGIHRPDRNTRVCPLCRGSIAVFYELDAGRYLHPWSTTDVTRTFHSWDDRLQIAASDIHFKRWSMTREAEVLLPSHSRVSSQESSNCNWWDKCCGFFRRLWPTSQSLEKWYASRIKNSTQALINSATQPC